MHIDPLVVTASLGVGALVGLTGMGGGALLTPVLILLFGVPPLAAVSSDLVASVVMRPVGAAVHFRRGTVITPLVGWLVLGSVPSAFAGVLILRSLGARSLVDSRMQLVLGIALLVAMAAIVGRSQLQRRRPALAPTPIRPFVAKPVPTVLVGIVGGLVVGMTSVGSGSLMIVALLVIYPELSLSHLVGTDLVQAVPLVASAALGHLLFGDVKLGLSASLILGSVPGVYLGARLSSRASDRLIRPVMAIALLATGLKLLGVPTPGLGGALVAAAALALAVTMGRRLLVPLSDHSPTLPRHRYHPGA